MLNKNIILDKLRTVLDPELQVNIVDLGLIYEVKVDKENNVSILMTLTSPGCPLSYVFDMLIREAVSQIKEVKKIEIELSFDPPWNPERMTEEVKMQLGWMG